MCRLCQPNEMRTEFNRETNSDFHQKVLTSEWIVEKKLDNIGHRSQRFIHKIVFFFFSSSFPRFIISRFFCCSLQALCVHFHFPIFVNRSNHLWVSPIIHVRTTHTHTETISSVWCMDCIGNQLLIHMLLEWNDGSEGRGGRNVGSIENVWRTTCSHSQITDHRSYCNPYDSNTTYCIYSISILLLMRLLRLLRLLLPLRIHVFTSPVNHYPFVLSYLFSLLFISSPISPPLSFSVAFSNISAVWPSKEERM